MTTPIRDVLQTLNRHSGVIEQGFAGLVSGAAGTPGVAISELRLSSALRAVGEDGFRLHPRLREYLQDHLQMYPAYQSLAEIGSKITQASALWDEIDLVRSTDSDTLDMLVNSLHTCVYDIADNMNSNVLLLQTLLHTRFGNVRTMVAKKSQNRYYQLQTTALGAELGRLVKVMSTIEGEVNERGMSDLARFLRRHCLSPALDWQQSLSEMQTEIRKELFRTREIEKNMKQLTRMDMLLRQQPSWRGFHVELEGDIPAFLLAASLPEFAAHIEPMDSDRFVRDELELIARALPPPREPKVEAAPPRRYTLVVDEDTPVAVLPAAAALEQLVIDLRSSELGISLIDWRVENEDAMTMREDVWLVFAVMGLRNRKVRIDLVDNPPEDGEMFKHSFKDARARKAAIA